MPDPLDALTVAELRRRTSMKWRTYPPDVLPLWVAEMDVPLAEPVARALGDAVRLGDTGYPVGTGYAEALAGFAADRWGWDGLAVGRTALVADVMQGVVEVLRLVTSPGEAVVVNPPAYPPFYGFVEHADRRVVEAPLTPEHRPDPDALRAAFAEATAGGRPAAYLLCHPHNPTGAVYRESELATIAELAAAYRVRVVVDEIHAPLVLPGTEFRPYLSLPGTEDAFAIYSASKGWNLAGLKAAVVVAGEVAAADLARLPEEVSHGPSHIGVLAHTAALREGGAWLDAVLAGLDRNRKLLGDLLADRLPAIRWLPPEGTYFAWLDCRGLDLPTSGTPGGRGVITSLAGPAGVFLERGRVALSDGPAFGTGGAGHVRLNMATTPEILGAAVDRMARAVTDRQTLI